MTIFGLNSPELFVLIVITLVILGTKRIEKGLDLFSKVLKFLLSNQIIFDNKDKKKESIKAREGIQEKEEEITKIEETTNASDKESIKAREEIQEKGDKSKKSLKKTNVDNIEEKSAKTKDAKTKDAKIKDGKTNFQDNAVNELKTKSRKKAVKDKTVAKSKTINAQKDQLEK